MVIALALALALSLLVGRRLRLYNGCGEKKTYEKRGQQLHQMEQKLYKTRQHKKLTGASFFPKTKEK